MSLTKKEIEQKFIGFATKFKNQFLEFNEIDSDLVGYSFKLKNDFNTARIYYIDFFGASLESIEVCIAYYSFETIAYHYLSTNYYNWDEINDDLFIKYLDKFEMYLLME